VKGNCILIAYVTIWLHPERKIRIWNMCVTGNKRYKYRTKIGMDMDFFILQMLKSVLTSPLLLIQFTLYLPHHGESGLSLSKLFYCYRMLNLLC